MGNLVVIEKVVTKHYEDVNHEYCPQCKLWAFVYKCSATDEISIDCNFCGYHYSHILMIDQERTSLDPYNREIAMLDREGNVEYDIQEKKGFGVSSIYRKNRGKAKDFNEPITEEDIEEFRTKISLPEVDRNKSYLTR